MIDTVSARHNKVYIVDVIKYLQIKIKAHARRDKANERNDKVYMQDVIRYLYAELVMNFRIIYYKRV